MRNLRLLLLVSRGYAVARCEQYLLLEGDTAMNIKALITTLVLGSSSLAAADSFAVNGSVRVSLSSADPCDTPAPARPYVPAPSRPVYQHVAYETPTSNY